MNREALHVQALCFQYAAWPGMITRPLFRDLNFSLPENHHLVIHGPPASGKTTLARILIGAVPRFAGGELEGSILWKSRQLVGCPPYQLLDVFGLLFQNSEEQIICANAQSEVAFAQESLGLPVAELRRRVKAAFCRLKIEHLIDRKPATLSGGEKKLILAAALIVQDPEIWLIDEGFDELHPASEKLILGYLAEKQKTVIFFTARDSSPAAAVFADTVTEMDLRNGCLQEHRQSQPIWSGKIDLFKTSQIKADQNPDHQKILVKVENLGYQNQNSVFKLDCVNFKLYSCDLLLIQGANGSGKTTLARLLCGLAKPDTGKISASRGEGLVDLKLSKRGGFFGYLFQNPDHQIFLPTVREELLLFHPQAGHRRQASAVVANLIKRFNLPGAEASPSILSYGDRKKVQAAICHEMKRPVLIIDEGDSGLAIGDFIKTLRLLSQTCRALIVISHDRNLAGLLNCRRATMDKGRLIEQVGKEFKGE